jgi:hypothetical protein
MGPRDWYADAALAGRTAALAPLQRRQAATLALWRLRSPLFAFELDADWGADPSVLESLFRSAASAPGEQSDTAYRQAIFELRGAPLFTSEIDPEMVAEVQLETIDRLLTFGETLNEAGAGEIERIIDCPRVVANGLDQRVEDSLHVHPSQDAHDRYLTTLAGPVQSYGLGYHASRNLSVEFACHNALQTLPPAEGLLDTSAGRDLLALCEALSAELVSTLRWLTAYGH